MCAEVGVLGEWCGNQGQLAAVLGGPLPMRPDYAPEAIRDDICLCPVDIDAALSAVGLIAAWPFALRDDQMDYEAVMPGHEGAENA